MFKLRIHSCNDKRDIECDVMFTKLEYKIIEEIKTTYLINVLRDRSQSYKLLSFDRLKYSKDDVIIGTM